MPVVFSVNGSRIVPEGEQTIIEYSCYNNWFMLLSLLVNSRVMDALGMNLEWTKKATVKRNSNF